MWEGKRGEKLVLMPEGWCFLLGKTKREGVGRRGDAMSSIGLF